MHDLGWLSMSATCHAIGLQLALGVKRKKVTRPQRVVFALSARNRNTRARVRNSCVRRPIKRDGPLVFSVPYPEQCTHAKTSVSEEHVERNRQIPDSGVQKV